MSLAVQAQTLRTERNEIIFPLQNQHVHGSSIVCLPNGDLLVAWFQGSGERSADDVRIMGARLKKGASQWTKPFVLADTPDIPDCNPVLFLGHDRTLYLVWIAVQANRWENSVLRILSTKNYANVEKPIWTWQDNLFLKPGQAFEDEVVNKFKEMPPSGAGWSEYAPKYDKLITEAAKDPGKRSFGWMTRIKPLLLKDKRIILPLYSDGYNFSMMAISDDDGKTWKPSLPLVGRGPIQPALAQRKDGTLVALMRDSGDSPTRVHYSESKDNGYSWTASVKTEIPNTASVELLVLQNGKWVFVGNDMEDSRKRLSLFVSADEGKTWSEKYIVEENEKGSFSYPSLIQSADGNIHLTYSYHLEGNQKSIKYIKIKPENLSP